MSKVEYETFIAMTTFKTPWSTAVNSLKCYPNCRSNPWMKTLQIKYGAIITQVPGGIQLTLTWKQAWEQAIARSKCSESEEGVVCCFDIDPPSSHYSYSEVSDMDMKPEIKREADVVYDVTTEELSKRRVKPLPIDLTGANVDLLPPGWDAIISSKSGKMYYANPEQMMIQLDPPRDGLVSVTTTTTTTITSIYQKE